MLSKLKLFWPKTRTSHPLSKILRPLFEGKKPKQHFGLFLVAIIFLTGLLVHPASAFEAYPDGELLAMNAPVEVKTQKGMSFPLKTFSISQGYWLFHPAIDLAAAKGTAVYPIKAGKIEKIERGHFGYGHYLIIDHGQGLKSRYAHLSKIEVQESQNVDQVTIIGRIGSTGWATGNHLHLEIKENDKYLNPRVLLH